MVGLVWVGWLDFLVNNNPMKTFILGIRFYCFARMETGSQALGYKSVTWSHYNFAQKADRICEIIWFAKPLLPKCYTALSLVFFTSSEGLPSHCFFSSVVVISEILHQLIHVLYIPSLKLTGSQPARRPGPKRKGSSSNHLFSGAFAVSGRVNLSSNPFNIYPGSQRP